MCREMEVEFFDSRDHLAEHQLRIADQRDLSRHLPSDARCHRVALDILRLIVPGRHPAEMLTAPEAKTQRQHDVGAARERFLKGAANGQRMLLGNRSLAGTPPTDWNRPPPSQFLLLRRSLPP